MTPKSRRIVFYLISYVVIALTAVFCLSINIRTVPLIENRQKVLLQTQELQQENRKLEFIVTSANRLLNVDKKAQELGLKKVKRLNYIEEL